MNIDDIKLGDLKKIAAMFSGATQNDVAGEMIGKYVIIRTYSAGVWFGILDKKCGKEVILKDARRMYEWWCARGISLSSVALYGLNQDQSKICAPVDAVWLEAIEILPTNSIATESLKSAKEAQQS